MPPARVLAALALPLAASSPASGDGPTPETPAAEAAPAAPAARDLFDGKTLEGWVPAGYAGDGGAEVTPEGTLLIKRGDGHLNGLKRTDGDALPKVGYEVTLEARRIEGTDFFCCITFPFHDSHASFVLGGWGGSVCGISCIDYMDAMENMTMTVREFDDERWYKVRLIVSDHRLQAFIDGERMVNANVKDRKVGMRFGEIEDSVPFGLSTFQTTGEFRNIRLRPLAEAEKEAAAKLDEEDEF